MDFCDSMALQDRNEVARFSDSKKKHAVYAWPPDFLAIGHVAKDLTQDRYVLGGAVTFAVLFRESVRVESSVGEKLRTRW